MSSVGVDLPLGDAPLDVGAALMLAADVAYSFTAEGAGLVAICETDDATPPAKDAAGRMILRQGALREIVIRGQGKIWAWSVAHGARITATESG